MHDPVLAREALDALPAHLRESHLVSPDLAPVPARGRTWSTYNFAALWISMAHCIPTYMLAGGLIASGMSWLQALVTIGLGNVIVLVPILLNAHPGTKYGIPFPVLARASFGTAGAQIPALARAFVACGWFGINTVIGGEALRTFVTTFWPGYDALGGGFAFFGLPFPNLVCFLAFWGLNMWVVLRGMEAVRVFENWAAPVVLVLAALLLGWMTSEAGGLGPLFDRPSRYPTLAEFWPVFVPALTGMVGFWATLSLNIPDFTRFGASQRAQLLGQTLGLPTTMIGFSLMAVVITSASAVVLPGVDPSTLWDPQVVLGHLTRDVAPPGRDAPIIASAGLRAVVAVVAMLGVVIATVSVNVAANVVSPANDFANIAPKKISFERGALITGLLGIACLPWKLLANPKTYIDGWLIGYSALLGPIAGILIADYFFLRKTQLDVAALYDPAGPMRGTNKAAVGALLIAVLLHLPGFLRGIGLRSGELDVFDAMYPYAWFTGTAVAAVLYVALSRVLGAPRAVAAVEAR